MGRQFRRVDFGWLWKRLGVARQIWSRWWGVIVGLYGLAGVLIFVRDEVLPRYLSGAGLREWQDRIVLPHVSWYAWVIGALALLVILGFQGSSRAILARDSQIVQLEQQITQIRSMVSPEHMLALKSVLEKLTLPYEPMLPQPLSVDAQVLEEGLLQHEPDTPFWKLRAEYLRDGEQRHAGEQELRESIQAAIARRRLGNMGGADGMYWSYAESLCKGRPVTPFGAWIEDASLARRPNNPFAVGYAFDSIIGFGDENERARRKVALEEVWNLIPSLPVLDRVRMADAEIARLRPLVEREAAKLAHKTSFTKPTCHLCAHRGSKS